MPRRVVQLPSHDAVLARELRRRDRRVRRRFLWGMSGALLGAAAAKWGPWGAVIAFLKEVFSK